MAIRSPYIDPEIYNRVHKMVLRARAIVEGTIVGQHRSPYHGFSVEFRQHREYAPGDDLRYLDWKVFGRSDRFFLKQYEQETNFIGHILVDLSESMRYGSKPNQTKAEYAKLLAATLSYLILQQRDAVAVGVFTDRVVQYVPPSTNPAHLYRICHVFESTPAAEKTDLGAILGEFASRLRRRGVVIIISDFFDDLDRVLSGLQYLKFNRHDLIAFQILDEFERSFPFRGLIRFEGMEDEGIFRTQPERIRHSYQELFGRFAEGLKAGCERMDVDFQQVLTARPVDAAIREYLARRR
ncbi:MAG: DUF58 domain-containing protein [Candidatus Sumerlaeia bacterium]|nr:DUF58 domain-containing protein [Candidatus Sumerlaeia bacterium]